ncbi:putative sugar kinase [marine actinobacterium PHSC20C1]|nr:putative sugar kinase [marine actinobacterium PHSC20C1]
MNTGDSGASSSGAFIPGGLVTLGETMGLFRPHAVGSLATESEFSLTIGGAESNVAIGVSRLGGNSTWIGSVGADSLGDRVVRELRAEGVQVNAAIRTAARTGLMIKERRTPAITRVSYYRTASAGSQLFPDQLDTDVIAQAGVLHVSGITPALSATAAETVQRAVTMARDAGVLVSFDVNHRATLWESDIAAPVYRQLAAASDIVFAGEEEAAMLVGAGSASVQAHRIAGLGASQVLIKLGEHGCLALVDGKEHLVAAVRVDAVDTVGAGDAFVAGYLAELLEGRDVPARLHTAVRTGAFACLGPADWESYPMRAELGLLDGGDPVSR